MTPVTASSLILFIAWQTAASARVVERSRVGTVALGATAASLYEEFRDRARLVDLKLEGHLSPALELRLGTLQVVPSLVAEISPVMFTGWAVPAPRLERSGQQATRRMVPKTVDRLTIGEFYFGEELDRFYNAEQPRLERLCMGRTDFHACRQRNLRPFGKRLASVHVRPSSDSPVVGELHAVLSFHPQFDLGYRIEFRPGNGGRARVWLESAGDWGYGIEIPGVRGHGSWIQLFDHVLPPESWIRSDSPLFHGEATTLVGQLVTLPSLPARYPDGSTRRIPPGSYLIAEIRGARVHFREEVATDMPCGEDLKRPDVMPPTLAARAADLFAPQGAPLFSFTYSKGC